MHHYQYLKVFDLHYYCGQDPFSLADLLTHIKERKNNGGVEGNIGTATFFDLRDVDLLSLADDDVRRFASDRRALGDDTVQNPFATVVGDLGSFGKMRLYGIYADVNGLREESMCFTSLDVNEAVDWMSLHLPEPDRQALGEALRDAESHAKRELNGSGSDFNTLFPI